MSDKQPKPRRGGCFTFLIAVAALFMSSVSLYVDRDQLGEVTDKGRTMFEDLENKFHDLEAEFENWKAERGGDEMAGGAGDAGDGADSGFGVDFGELRNDLKGALDALFAEENLDSARERISAINAKIDDYIAHLRDDVAPEVREDLEGLKEKGTRALESMETDLKQTEDDVRAMFRQVKLLDKEQGSK